MMVVLLVNYYRKINFSVVAGVLIFGILFYYLAHERIDRMLDGEDGSARIRMAVGLEIIKDHFVSGEYFGVSEGEANQVGYLMTGRDNVLDNYIYYKVIVLGLFALPFFIVLFLFLGWESFLYLFLFGFYNGTLFYYDRGVLLYLLFLVLSINWRGGLLMVRHKGRGDE